MSEIEIETAATATSETVSVSATEATSVITSEAETITEWKGYKRINFTVKGRESFIVCPDKPIDENRWVWRTEFFGAFDYADIALLKKGWYLAYHRVSDMYGCPESIGMMREFYDVAVEKYHLNPHPVLFGFSRGGLYAVNFALEYPNIPGALYLDAPVLDIRSWPGAKGVGTGDPACWQECKRLYGLTEETALTFNKNPLDNTEELATTGIPVMLVCGGKDKVVPFCENGEPFYNRFKKAGGTIKQIVKAECDHHPHSLFDPSPIVRFIEEQTICASRPVFPDIKVNVIGDSITYGAYTGENDDSPASTAEMPWCAVMAERLGFKALRNYGISGTSISRTSHVLPEMAFSVRYDEMSDDADLIIVAGGTNDFGTSVKLGSQNDEDDTSFFGGLNCLCKGLKIKYPDSVTVFITPFDRENEDKNDCGFSLEEYRKAIKSVAEENGFPVIEGDRLGLKGKTDYLMSDGTHPTPIAHKMLGDRIAERLAKILLSTDKNK